MIDNYTKTAIVLRAITTILLAVVLVKQLKLLRPVTKVQWVKVILITIVTIMLSNSVLALALNFFRQEDGNLSPNARHISLVWNAVSGVAAATGYAILYYRKDN